MNQTPNIEHRTSNIELPSDVGSLGIWRVLSRILNVVLAGIFIYAGILKAIDPVQFASDIDNYKILPWPVSVALAFYLPWLEIFCALGLVFRFLYRGALSILSASTVIFTLATGGRTGNADAGQVGALAADVMADAIVRAARQATGVPGFLASLG